jgi:hypothetical protein
MTKEIEKLKFPDIFLKCNLHLTRTCEILNIHHSTFYHWQATDQEFKQKIDDIRLMYMENLESIISNAAFIENKWQAAKCILQAKYPDVWGLTVAKIEHSHSYDKNLSPEIIQQQIEILKQVKDGIENDSDE